MVELKEICPTSEPGRVAESIISECGKNALRNVAEMPYMLRKCPKMLQESLLLQKCPNHVAKMPQFHDAYSYYYYYYYY